MSRPADAAPPGSETIGPYRVLGPLGRGGMGEVFLAHDPRLDREVAIKRIRAEADAAGRKRFQREARLAASLSHSAIVPVYDFVASGEHEYLVMERIEGPSLRHWLEREPSFEQRLAVAAQIAAGLAYAHGRGIVHRDLKTENVLLSIGPPGQVAAKIAAKITDFGLARRASPFAADPGAAGGEESRLTREGVLMGTFRAMAPEQVWGEEADARSDLFSFGVLLYELFGGSSPFAAESPSETLRRLTQQPHPPLAGIVPGLPPALERLIDRLLEKEKDLRPQSAEEVLEQLERLRQDHQRDSAETLPPAPLSAVAGGLGKRLAPRGPGPWRRSGLKRTALAAAALGVLAAAGWLLPWAGRDGGEPTYAAVLSPRFEGLAAPPGPEQQRLAFAVRGAALRQLGNLEGLSPKTFEEVDQAGAVSLRELAAAAGADELLRPAIFCSGADCRLRLERLRARDGATLGSEESELSLEDPGLSARSAQIAARRLYAELAPRREDPPIAAEHYSHLLEIRQELAAKPDSQRLDARLEDLRQLREAAPALVEAAWLEAEIAWRRYAETRLEGFRERARSAMAEAAAAAPDDLDVLLRAAWLAALDQRPADAAAALARFESLAPGDLRVIDQRAMLLEQEGKLEAALALRRQAAERRPSWVRSYNLAFAAFQLSRWDEARETLDRLLAAAPGHGRALSLRARLELVGGDPDLAIARYRALLERGESLLDRANLATAHLLRGDGAAAAAEIETVLAAAPGHAYFRLTLADARQLEGRRAEAEALYAEVAQALENEDDWQSLSVRAQAHAHLRQNEKAYGLLQEALRKAPPDDRAMAFEAALVYSLLGDRTAALVHIRQMSDWGWGGWLRLAPFAVWKDDPDIGPLLRRGALKLRPP